jgi:hypothetical protein
MESFFGFFSYSSELLSDSWNLCFGAGFFLGISLTCSFGVDFVFFGGGSTFGVGSICD